MRDVHNLKAIGFAASAGLAICAPAYAQQTAPVDASDSGNLQEIVVTAEKRGENLQRTPISITAITPQQIELQRIREVRDLSALAPNVSVLGGSPATPTAAVVSIRGIPSSADETQGFDSPIGMYLDGVYLARSSAANFDVGEIERIEVLRGPQGTLFGRNTTGGAINFITKQPGDIPGIRGEVGYGNFNQLSGRFTLDSGAIGDKLRMSFSYLHRQRDGVVDNRLTSDARDPGASRVDAGRFSATLALTDNIKLTNTFDYTRLKDVPTAGQLIAVGNGAVRPNMTIDGGLFRPVQPANVAAFLAQSTITQAGCGKAADPRYSSTICLDTSRPSDSRLWGDMFRAEIDLGGASIRSTTAYREWHGNNRGSDLDGLGTINGPIFTSATALNGFPQAVLAQFQPAATAAALAARSVPGADLQLFTATSRRNQRQISQEIEIVSEKSGPFQWVVGGFFFHESGNERNPQQFAAVLDTNAAVFTSASFGAMAPVLQAANPMRYRASLQSSTLAYRASGTSYAVYGQGTFRPNEGPLGITLGLRYTWDEKKFTRFQNGAAPYSSAVDIALNSPKPAHFQAPTGNFTLDYRASPDINFFARVARGYRSGGFNARQTTDITNAVSLRPFDNEIIWSYEAGAKTEFFGRLRLNASVFHNSYSDLQVTVPIPIASGGSFGSQVVNAGKVDYTGFELEGQFVVDDHLSLDGNFGYLHTKYKTFTFPDSTGTLRNIASVVSASYAPKYTGNIGATYRYPFASGPEIVGRVSWNYVASFAAFGNPITAPFRQETRSTAHGLFDAQLRLEGLSFAGGGSEIEIAVWAKNIANKKWVARTVDYGQLGFATALFGDPRTFGATLGFKF